MPALAQPLRKATNITLSVDVFADAKAFGINISQACDAYLRELVRQERQRRWREENADAMAVYNLIVAEEGLPLDEFRSF